MVTRPALWGYTLKRPDVGKGVPLAVTGIAVLFYKGLEVIFAREGVGYGGTAFVAVALAALSLIWGWWFRAQDREDAAWMTRLNVFVVDHYPVSREDAALTFARRWAPRLPFAPYRFNCVTGPRRFGARYWVEVTRDGVVTVSRDWVSCDATTRSMTRRYTVVPRLTGSPLAIPTARPAVPAATLPMASPSLPVASPALPVASPTPPASFTLTVTLTAQPRLKKRSGRTNEAVSIGLVIILTTFVIVEVVQDRPMITGFFGGVAAFLLALVASLAAFGTTSNLKTTARWRMVAAAELVEVAGHLGVSFPDALALLHSDEDSRSKTVEHLSFGRFMGDYFTCVRGQRRLTLHRAASGWTLTTGPT